MLSPSCHSCSQRTTFGFRPRDTFDVNGPKGCKCIISEKDVISDFLKFMQSNELLLDLTQKKVKHDITESQSSDSTTCTIPTRKQIQVALSTISHHDTIKKLENIDELRRISKYVSDVTRKLYKDDPRISQWEYLDVGCGTGRISRDIADTLEVMTQHTDIKDNRIGKYSHEEYVDFMIFDGVDLPYKDDMYLVVTCLTVLHHVENPSDLIKNICRVLKPGGILIIRGFNCRNWKNAYSLDFMHQLLSEGMSEDISIVDYRSRNGWREFITTSSSLKLLKNKYAVFPEDCPYNRYCDVFQKPYKTKSNKKAN